MWIWIVSLVVVIACVIFAYWMIVSSYDEIPAKQKFPFIRRTLPANKQANETVAALRSKIKDLEEHYSYQDIQFSKLHQRLQSLEGTPSRIMPGIINQQQEEEEENWKELYYEENEKKEKLENELDELRQLMEETQSDKSLNTDNEKLAALQSEHDARMSQILSLQKETDQLQLKLEAATTREKDLQQQLQKEIDQLKKYAQLESAYTQLKCENENMRAHLREMNKREEELENRLAHARELESRVAIYEEEKSKLVSEMDSRLGQNKVFYSGNQ